MVTELQRGSRKGGLEMNTDKTKYMRNVEGKEEGASLENGRIEEVGILGTNYFSQDWAQK